MSEPRHRMTEITARELSSGDTDELIPFAAEYSDKQIKICCSGCGQKLDVTELEPFLHIACPVCGKELVIPMHFDRYMLENPEKEQKEPCIKFYTGFDMTLERKVRISILRPVYAQQQEMCEAFLQNTAGMASINHFAVVPVYNCGTVRGIPYAVSQYMENSSLRHLLEQGKRIPLFQTLQWIRDSASALAYAAGKNIFHGNLTFDHMMLAADFHVKLDQFSNRFPSREDAPFSDAEKIFLPIERLEGDGWSHPSDIYSLGIVFYCLLTGRMPFENCIGNELLMRKKKKISFSFFDNIPRKIRETAEKMLLPDPELRLPGAEIEKILTEYMESEKRLARHK